MIYSATVCYAMRLAYTAHNGQEDKENYPYIHHVLHVAEQMDDEDSTVVALLHDVIEDCDYTVERLYVIGFSPEIVQAVDLLSRKDGQSYKNYIKDIKSNALATKVKLADLAHNMDLSRLPVVSDEDFQRAKKYRRAWEYLLH